MMMQVQPWDIRIDDSDTHIHHKYKLALQVLQDSYESSCYSVIRCHSHEYHFCKHKQIKANLRGYIYIHVLSILITILL